VRTGEDSLNGSRKVRSATRSLLQPQGRELKGAAEPISKEARRRGAPTSNEAAEGRPKSARFCGGRRRQFPSLTRSLLQSRRRELRLFNPEIRHHIPHVTHRDKPPFRRQHHLLLSHIPKQYLKIVRKGRSCHRFLMPRISLKPSDFPHEILDRKHFDSGSGFIFSFARVNKDGTF